jgi:hypothetical protein
MKASEYQVSVSPHLKNFKWVGRSQTSLDWQKFKNKFEDVAKIKRVEQLFEKDSTFYQWRRTTNDTIRSVRDVSTSTEIRCKDIMIKMSEQNDGEIDYVTNLQRRAKTFLGDLRTKSPLNFRLIQNLDIHPTNHHQLGAPVIPPSTIHVSQFAHEFKTDEEMNEKFLEFLYSDRVRIRYLMHLDAHFTDEELRSGHYISVSEFNDCRRVTAT